MKKIVITITLKEPILPFEQSHVLEHVTNYLAEGSFKEDLEDGIPCQGCQACLDIKKIEIQLR